MLCACNQLFCVHKSCQNNENNTSDVNTGFPIFKVHMWDIMFARERYLQSFCRVFENQVCQWLSIRIEHILERLNLQSTKSSVNQKQKVRKFVFIKWLAAKVRLFSLKCNSTTTFHKIYGQNQLRFNRYLNNVAICEMP